MFSILEQQDAVSIEHRLSCFIVLVLIIDYNTLYDALKELMTHKLFRHLDRFEHSWK